MKKTLAVIFFFSVLFFLASNSTYAVFGTNATAAGERQNLRATVSEERKEFRASVSAEIHAKREEFKLRLQTIRDERKKTLLEKIQNRIAEINRNRMESLTKHLEKMTELLIKIEARVQEEKAKGKDVSLVEAAILTAKNAIEAAQTAVDAQKAKVYVLTIQSEATLRQTVSQNILVFEADLKKARDLVISAKKSVMDVYQEFARLRNEKEASPSGKINP